MTIHFYSRTECEHGSLGICDHIPRGHGGPCMRLDCNVLHATSCPGGQRRELSGVEIVDWCEVHKANGDEDICWSGAVFSGSTPCRITSHVVIPLEDR